MKRKICQVFFWGERTRQGERGEGGGGVYHDREATCIFFVRNSRSGVLFLKKTASKNAIAVTKKARATDGLKIHGIRTGRSEAYLRSTFLYCVAPGVNEVGW